MPTIRDEQTYQTVITTFETSPGDCEALLEKLKDAYAAFISQQPGFVAAALHVNDARTRIANYSQWTSRENYWAMLRSEEMRGRNRVINQLCRGFEPVMYDVALTFN